MGNYPVLMTVKYVYESLWGSTLPPDVGGNSGGPLTLGVRLRFAVAGRIVGMRVAVAEDNACEHFGMIVTATNEGAPLRGIRFHPTPGGGLETDARWHHGYCKALDVAADDELVAMCWFPNGRFWSEVNGLQSAARTRGNITAPQTGDGGDNGVYAFGSGWDLPLTFNGNLYGVDVLYLTDTEANRA